MRVRFTNGFTGGHEDKSGYVYCLMDQKNNTCKIGMSQHETNRIKSLQQSHPFPTIYKIKKVLDRCECENYLHRLFCERRFKGEWFKNVSFDEYELAIKDYNIRKYKQHLDSLEFYRWLFDTPFEYKNGTPIKAWDLMRKRTATILVVFDNKFQDKYLFRTKMDFMLKDLFINTNINLITMNGYDNDFTPAYVRGKEREYTINRLTFFGNYDYKNHIINQSMTINLKWAIDYCYGVIFFCVKPNNIMNIVSEYAKSKSVKIRTVISQNKSNYSQKSA